MTNERNELTRVIAEADGSGHFLRNGRQFAYGPLADAILAAGYRKPAVVTTAEELDALPHESVVLDCEGDAWQRTNAGWYIVTSGTVMSNLIDYLPATVLHVGGES